MGHTFSSRASVGLRAALALAVPLVVQVAAEDREPGFNELVIYDPGVQDNGLPGIQFYADHGTTKIEIPPALHVHRYYYNGEKEYQGPLMSGGPVVVVANHPRSGKRMYIDAQLPSGAPVIRYDKRSITYLFPNQRVVLTFSCLGDDSVKVATVTGHGNLRRMRENEAERDDDTPHALSQSLRDVRKSVHDTAVGAVVATGHVASGAVDRVKAVYDAIPVVRVFQGAAEQRVERGATETLRQAQIRADEAERRFLPTNR